MSFKFIDCVKSFLKLLFFLRHKYLGCSAGMGDVSIAEPFNVESIETVHQQCVNVNIEKEEISDIRKQQTVNIYTD